MWFAGIAIVAVAILFIMNDKKNEKKIKQYIEDGTAPENLSMLQKTVFYMEQNDFSNADIADMMEKYEDSIINNSDAKSLKTFYNYAIGKMANKDTIDSYFRFNHGIFNLLAKKENLTIVEQDNIYGIYRLCKMYDKMEMAKELMDFALSRDDLKKLAETMSNSDDDVENEKKKLEAYLNKEK